MGGRTLRRLLLALVPLALALAAPLAQADEAPETAFAQAVAALEKGDYPDAIDGFESLADRGFVHPDASYDRALAYLARVRAGDEHAGDLGRAAAALEETLLARPDDRDAESALELVRAEVARRRSRRAGGGTEVEARPTLERAVVGVAPEWLWAILAAFGSSMLTVGLVLRRARHDGPWHLAGTIAAPIGAVTLVAFAALAWGARHLRLTTDEAVVVATEARLVDERGLAMQAAVIPEAAKIEVGERRGGLVHVRWGAVEGWTVASGVRVIAR